MPPSKKQAKAPRKSDASVASLAAPPSTAAGKQPALIDEHVSEEQATRAFEALYAHQRKQRAAEREAGGSRNLLDDGDDEEDGDTSDKRLNVWLNVTLKQIDPKKNVKPVPIPLEHPIHTSASSSVCLLVKDPQRQYKDLLVEQKITSIARVVGVSKLKGKFAPFEARRQLLQDHDLFLADERIVTLLPKLLGTKFYEAKKQPVVVDISKKEKVKQNIEKALSSTFYLPNRGTNSAIKIGHMRTHTPSQLVANLRAALPAVVARVRGKWGNVQALEVKLGASASLPIWNCKVGAGVAETDEAGRWAGTEIVVEDEEMDAEAELSTAAAAEPAAEVPAAAPAPAKAKKASAAAASAKAPKARSSASDAPAARKAAGKVQADAAKAKAKAGAEGKKASKGKASKA